MERSGQLSNDGLISYERITTSQKNTACKVLSNSSCGSQINSNAPSGLLLDHEISSVDVKHLEGELGGKPDANDIRIICDFLTWKAAP